jgi:NADH dehydrogenase
MWLFIHILFLVGFRNKLAVLLGWAFAYLRDNPSARVVAQPVDLSRVTPTNHSK